MNVQVWGRRYTNRIDLISACLNAVAAFGFLNLQKLPTFYKADLIVDLIDKTAQLNATLVLDGAVANLSDVLLRHRPFELVADGDFPAAIDGLTTTAPVQQPEPTYASGTRGVLTHLVHQALLNPCGTPTKPVDRVLINKGVGRTF